MGDENEGVEFVREFGDAVADYACDQAGDEQVGHDARLDALA